MARILSIPVLRAPSPRPLSLKGKGNPYRHVNGGLGWPKLGPFALTAHRVGPRRRRTSQGRNPTYSLTLCSAECHTFQQMVRTSSNPRVRAVQVRLTPEEMKTLQALAKKDQRSISNYIRWLIEKEAKKS